MLQSDQTQIGRLRLSGATDNGPATRLRMSQLVGGTEFHPSGMPPAAVLIVRRLRDPMPRRLSPSSWLEPATVRAWQGAARSSLADYYRHAARPALGHIASGAQAVVFDDPSELVACLARDLVLNRAIQHWWWQALLRRLPSTPARALVQVFEEQAAELPAALDRLDRWGAARPVVEALPPAAATALLLLIARTFGIEGLALPTEAHPGGMSREAESTTRRPTGESTFHRKAIPETTPSIRPVPPPWQTVATPVVVPATMAKERAALLGTALLLYRAPRSVRAGTYGATLRSWWTQHPTPPATPDADSPTAIDRDLQSALSSSRSRIRKDRGHPERNPGTEALPGSPPSTAAPMTAETQAHRHTPKLIDGLSAASADPPPADPETSSRVSTPEVELLIRPLPSRAVATSLGGVLYLVNLVRPLGLLAPIDSLFSVRTSMSAWPMLELVGRCLTAHAATNTGNDPIWNTLAELDGRSPDEPPRDDFGGPASYRLPRTWPLPALTHHLEVRAWQAPPGLRLEPDLRRFLEFLMPYLECRLAEILGHGHQGGDPDDATWLECKGRLFVTRTHLDLVMGMDQVSIPVRKAGLDANPGWVPELGRVITFHFDEESNRE